MVSSCFTAEQINRALQLCLECRELISSMRRQPPSVSVLVDSAAPSKTLTPSLGSQIEPEQPLLLQVPSEAQQSFEDTTTMGRSPRRWPAISFDEGLSSDSASDPETSPFPTPAKASGFLEEATTKGGKKSLEETREPPGALQVFDEISEMASLSSSDLANKTTVSEVLHELPQSPEAQKPAVVQEFREVNHAKFHPLPIFEEIPARKMWSRPPIQLSEEHEGSPMMVEKKAGINVAATSKVLKPWTAVVTGFQGGGNLIPDLVACEITVPISWIMFVTGFRGGTQRNTKGVGFGSPEYISMPAIFILMQILILMPAIMLKFWSR